jgi:hypothetical protein
MELIIFTHAEKELPMSSIAQIETALRQLLIEDAERLAREMGVVQRHRNLSGADLASILVFGWMQEAALTLDGFSQLAQVRQVCISAPGLSKRFGPAMADWLLELLQRATRLHLRAQTVNLPLLRRFTAVVIEDSSQVPLPDDLKEVWKGCGGRGKVSEAQVKLHVRWDLCSGQLDGPVLSDGRVPDTRSPLREDPLPAGSLYLGDLGYFDLMWLKAMSRRTHEGKRYFLTRLKHGVKLYTHKGHELLLRGILPHQLGHVVQYGVQVGSQARVVARLLIVKVPKDVADQRREELRQEAKDQGREVSAEQLYLADWTVLITNVPTRLLSMHEVFALLRVRWQIEWLFKRWKAVGQIDEWRGKDPWRILCEVYAKLIGLLIHHWVLLVGCWQDPYRSLYKAGQVVRAEARRLFAALSGEGSVEQVLRSMVRQMKSGCRLNTRKKHPSTAQILAHGSEWALS